jgi:hypothetical protein
MLKQYVSDEYCPKPTVKFLPEWYKKTDSYIGIDKNNSFGENATIKKCIPVFDVLTLGYTITTYCDIFIKNNNGNIEYKTPTSLGMSSVEFHTIAQAPYHPNVSNQLFPKFINPWSITTPKGYSSLFIPPVHSANTYFKILEGFVDTDRYNCPVNFPFVLNDLSFQGLIPAGTPVAQVVPIKRESWIMEEGSDKDLLKMNQDSLLLNSKFYDRYKKIFWSKKQYN